MTAVITAAEVENLRFHLAYGNIQVGAYPWTPDGFFELFTNVIAQYLSTGAETTATTAITANTVAVVTPASMTDIVVNARLIVDVADDAEDVVVKAVTLTTFTARFLKAHTAAGYPIALESGVARLRLLLNAADRAWQALISGNILKTAGIKSLAREEIVWFGPYAVLRSVRDAYMAIVWEISKLVRVEPVDYSGATSRVEAY